MFIIITKGSFYYNWTELAYGILAGILSFITYILYLLSISGTDATISITIFHMNMIPGIILTAAFLGEVITFKRGAGIALCIISMLLFTNTNRVYPGDIQKKQLLMSIASCIMCGLLNYVNKLVAIKGTETFYVIFWRFVTVSLLSSILLWLKKPSEVTAADIKYPMMSGMIIILSIYCTLKALELADMGLVIPIVHLSFVLTVIICAVIYKEKLSVTKITGIVFAVFSITLIV